MPPRTRMACLLAICFLATAGETLVGQGLYFFAKATLRFTDAQNLALQLGISALSVIAAYVSHPISVRLGPKRLLWGVLVGGLACDAVLVAAPIAPAVVAVTLARACFGLMKWPVLESYISSGLAPRRLASALGWFNLSWAMAPLVALPLAGPLIKWDPRGLFLVSLVIGVVNVLLTSGLEPQPVHLHDEHPDHLPAADVPRYRALLVSGRMSLVSSSAAFMILSPLLPGVLAGLGVGILLGPLVATTFHLARLAAFASMYRLSTWHGRRRDMAAIALTVPAGFLLVLLGRQHLPLVIAGLAVFGLASGACYYTALYYAMVIKRASVEGGSMHEAVGALGNTAGPAVGLGGGKLGAALGMGLEATALGAAPFMALLATGAIWPLLTLPPRRHTATVGRPEGVP